MPRLGSRVRVPFFALEIMKHPFIGCFFCGTPFYNARMAELVDALVSGTSGRKPVQVRALFRAPQKSSRIGGEVGIHATLRG